MLVEDSSSVSELEFEHQLNTRVNVSSDFITISESIPNH
jgi:hypothetical protein